MSDVFKVNDVELKIRKISNEIEMEAQKVYASALNTAIMNDFPLRLEVTKTLESKNLLDSSFEEDKIDDVHKELRSLEKDLRSAVKDNRKMTKEEGRSIAMRMRALRSSLYDIGSDLNSYYQHTADQYAQNEKIQYYIFATTIRNDNGQKYWKTFDEFKSDVSNPVFDEATKQFIADLTGTSVNYEHYENKWLKRMGFLNDEGQLLNSDGHLVDDKGRLINEDGKFVNAKGVLIDKYGNEVDEDGNLLVDDGWDEE